MVMQVHCPLLATVPQRLKASGAVPSVMAVVPGGAGGRAAKQEGAVVPGRSVARSGALTVRRSACASGRYAGATPSRPCQPAPDHANKLHGRHGLACSMAEAPASPAGIWRGQPLRVCPRDR